MSTKIISIDSFSLTNPECPWSRVPIAVARRLPS